MTEYMPMTVNVEDFEAGTKLGIELARKYSRPDCPERPSKVLAMAAATLAHRYSTMSAEEAIDWFAMNIMAAKVALEATDAKIAAREKAEAEAKLMTSKTSKKDAPPVAAGRAKDCATDQEVHRAADDGGQARSREAMTLLQAVEAQDGISIRTGKTRPITFAAVLVDMPFWELEFGEPNNGPVNRVLSALIVLIGRVIGRTSPNEPQMEATLDRLHEYLIPWARDGFEELTEVLAAPHASEQGAN